jgi:hypothetical protein
VYGFSNTDIGVYGLTFGDVGKGVYGEANGSYAVGVYGTSDEGLGVFGNSVDREGVKGTSTNGAGVYGFSNTGFGVEGSSNDSYGIYGYSSNNFAAYFDGNIFVGGNCTGCLGASRIDHPLDPANKYLQHAAVQSQEMLNVYNGNVTLDAKGEAWIQLPEWFEALNKDFRYQLTAIGAPGPNLYIAEKVKGNRFKIAGGVPRTEVSWQVTGVRKDPYSEKHRIQVEEEKRGDEKGKYLHPLEHGQPESKGIDYERRQRDERK